MRADLLDVGVCIPTRNGASSLKRLLPALLSGSVRPRILVIDTDSSDQTLLVARSFGARIHSVSRGEFNHGTTRELGRTLLNARYLVMMSQDVVPCDEKFLANLLAPLRSGEAQLAYARQIAPPEASARERCARAFNYPPEGHIRSVHEGTTYNAYLPFFSNAAAAYCCSVFERVGGFSRVLFGEDTLFAMRALQQGCKIAYVAQASVWHAHHYTLLQEGARYFDIGYSRAENGLLGFGASEGLRGRAYAFTLLKTVAQESPRELPRALGEIMVKWIGFQVGQRSLRAPTWWKRMWSSHPAYFVALPE